MILDLFAFPTIMVDGKNEERKIEDLQRLGLPTDDEGEDLDIVYGEAEYPYYDFIGIEDRWIPNKESFQKALDKGKFDACLVKFANVGHLLVPLTKEEFKKRLTVFIDEKEREKEKEDEAISKKVTVLKITPELLAELLRKAEEDKDE